MWFIPFIPLESSLLLCCVAIHNKTTAFLPSSFLSAKSHCLVAKCRNQSKSLRRPVASTILDQEPPVRCCIGSGNILSSGFFQVFTMALLLYPYFSELWAFYSHRRSSVQVDECVIIGWPPEPHPGNTSVWLFAYDPKGFSSHVTLFSSPWLLFLYIWFWLGFFAMGNTGEGKDAQVFYQPLEFHHRLMCS